MRCWSIVCTCGQTPNWARAPFLELTMECPPTLMSPAVGKTLAHYQLDFQHASQESGGDMINTHNAADAS